jgi:Protein of unknown function (DUF3618)
VGETPDEIRRGIEETRGRMTETVEAIGYRADVKSRTKERIMGAKDSVVGAARSGVERLTAPLPSGDEATSAVSSGASSVSGATGSLAVRVADAIPDREQVREVVSVAQSNPIGLALGATAVGFLVGLVLPGTAAEDEKLGPLSDRIKAGASDAGQQALEHGKQVVQSAAEAAVETAKEEGREHGEELSSSLQDKARQATRSDSEEQPN